MGSLIVRNIDKALIARLKRRAARYQGSAEAEHREILRNALTADDRLAKKALQHRRHFETAVIHLSDI